MRERSTFHGTYRWKKARRVARIEAHGANTKALATATGLEARTGNRRFAVAARHATVLADLAARKDGSPALDRRSSALLRFRRPPSCDHSALRRSPELIRRNEWRFPSVDKTKKRARTESIFGEGYRCIGLRDDTHGERIFFIIAIGIGVVVPTGFVLVLLWS
jgi:hypothetical protein